ncbi:MAG: endolytic transglycosylase MltG [Fermentimonas sp.]|nr:endolytic transglycosylase MltG [Fermentimonas sp.]
MEQPKRNKKRTNIILLTAGILLLIIISAGIYIYNTIFEPFDLTETAYIYIDEEKDYNYVVNQLQEKTQLPNEKIFHLLADRMNYPNRIKTGRYAIVDGMTMPDVIRLLRSGVQAPVNLTFNNIRTKENLAGRFSDQLMADSLSIINVLNDTAVAASYGFNNQTFGAMFIPNTYEVYWDTSVENLISRMKREYDAFWNEQRKSKAEKLGLTPMEVSILASIVEEEATYTDEYSTVAGLYLNRLEKGMRLEADPTVKYAVGDPTLRRILFKHLEVESPYNTYKNDGLPPGPIRIPSIKGIDAVLNPTEHNFLFMCAKDDLSGRHNFAVTHAEHARNARAYQRALNERGIY